MHGILVQLPLPKHIDAQRIVESIAFDKDVDGLHAMNAGLTLMGVPHFRSCTPYGVMKMLESTGVAIEGAHAVVLGRSNMVGKPMAMLLLAANATVTIAHSKTRDLAAVTRSADILVAAVGRRNLVTADMVKPGAVVIDVGTNRTPEGKLAGDVDFDAVREVAGWISPVPGGVGPMTITMLLVNTVEAAERRAGSARLRRPAASWPLQLRPHDEHHLESTARLDGLTRFDRIRPEHVTPAVDALLADGARRGRAGDAGACRRRPGRPWSNRSTRRPTAWRAPGARSRT